MKMKIPRFLIDTCIVVTREGYDIKGIEHLDGDILELFKIIENNHIKCYIHSISKQEIQKSIESAQDKTTQRIREQTLSKLGLYFCLDTPDPYKESPESEDYLDRIDPGREALGSGREASHDKNDNILLYAAYRYRNYVSLITEDKDILKNAQLLGLQNVYSVKSALEYFKNYFHYFLSACPSGTIVAPGDTLHIRGTAAGNPGTLKMYFFGSDYFTAEDIFVEDDGSYDKKFDVPADLSPNQYYGIIQHPMYNDEFDVKLNSDGTRFCGSTSQDTLVVKGNNKLQGVQAADALTKMIDDANIDDIYTKLTFTVEAPWIRIVNPGDQAAGSKFTITGRCEESDETPDAGEKDHCSRDLQRCPHGRNL